MATKGEETRQRIVETALQLFSVKGYFGTSIYDVMQGANITKGGLYGHFPSKEALWGAAYDEAVVIWRGLVFQGAREIDDPLERIAYVVDRDLHHYLGGEVFAGGCFFLNCLLEVSGQSEAMSRKILRGFTHLSRLLASWLQAADEEGLLRAGVAHREVADFIVVSINGAAALYTASRDPRPLDITVEQVRALLCSLKAPMP